MGNVETMPRLQPIALGSGNAAVRIERPVILAPMSGVTDLPFRRLAKQQGAGLVVSEMIASWAMVRENRTTLRMAEVDGCGGPSAVQLAVGQSAGSALMRDEAAAARILEATVRAVQVPVTLKMRMGWDHASLNAPAL